MSTPAPASMALPRDRGPWSPWSRPGLHSCRQLLLLGISPDRAVGPDKCPYLVLTYRRGRSWREEVPFPGCGECPLRCPVPTSPHPGSPAGRLLRRVCPMPRCLTSKQAMRNAWRGSLWGSQNSPLWHGCGMHPACPFSSSFSAPQDILPYLHVLGAGRPFHAGSCSALCLLL